MSWIGHDGARIGEHANEAAKQSAVGERIQLPLHCFFLIKEPPAAAELDLARHTSILEIADDGSENIVVSRVQVIENDFGQSILFFQAAEVCAERLRLGPVANGIEANVTSEFAEGP